jgi:hypothetical protein
MDSGMGPDASSPNDTPVGLMSYLNKHKSLIALVVSFLAAICPGWQGYEMREANERADRAIQEAHAANQEARVANENARKANDALIELQGQQLELLQGAGQQQERALAERVYIDRSPDAYRADHPEAKWVVKNTDPRNYVSAVWVDGIGTDGKMAQWGIHDIAPCTAVGVDTSASYALRYVYYQDANGKRWQRLNRIFTLDGKPAHAPEPSTVDWPVAIHNYAIAPYDITKGCE